jgi:hypothetical protein
MHTRVEPARALNAKRIAISFGNVELGATRVDFDHGAAFIICQRDPGALPDGGKGSGCPAQYLGENDSHSARIVGFNGNVEQHLK